MAFTNDIEPAYRQRRASLQATFPAAHDFLAALEALHSEGTGFHLGTAENVHLYLGKRYLAYLRLELRTPTTPRLLLRARPNITIKDGTVDDSASLFGRPLNRLVMSHGGFPAGWAEKAPKGSDDDERSFTRDTPAAFFVALLGLIRHLATGPAQS